jgi:hypothetical protein
MFHHKSKGKGKKGESLSSSQVHSGTSAVLFMIMVLHNFYLYVLIHYYFITSHLIYFIIVFVCRALQPPNTDRRPFLGLCTMRANRRWLESGQRGWRFPRLLRSRRSVRSSRRLLRSRRSEWPSRRLLRSRTSEQPNRRLLRSRTSRMRLVTSHRSPIG